MQAVFGLIEHVYFIHCRAMTIPRRYFFCGSFMFFSVLCLLCLCERLFICALWSPAGKGLTSWLSFVVFNCAFVTFPLVSWVRCGTWLYKFLIFAPYLLCVVLPCLFLVAMWSPAGKGLTSWLSCLLCFVTFPNVSRSTSKLRTRLALQ